MPTTLVTVPLPEELHDRLMDHADEWETDLPTFILSILARHDREKRTPPPIVAPATYPGEPDPVREEIIFDSALSKIHAANGRWVPWHDLRPAFRMREVYGERIWDRILRDPDLETHEVEHGSRVRRQVRALPLI